jgi:outer membrane murein-binding lipoprotein Lpp
VAVLLLCFIFGITIILGVLLTLSAIDDLNANVAQLKTDVEAYIASKQGAIPADQVAAAASAVAALDAEVKSAQ